MNLKLTLGLTILTGTCLYGLRDAYGSAYLQSTCMSQVLKPDPSGSKAKTKLMEQCQVSYLMAVASQACCSFSVPMIDCQKLDLHISHCEQPGILVGVQLKSTAQDVRKKDHISFTIDRATHEVLRQKNLFPMFLLVLVMPPESNWVQHSEESLILQSSMYWADFQGEVALQKGTKAIKIPRSQVVNPEWLCSVFSEVVQRIGR